MLELPRVQLVIARYSEDVSWLGKINYPFVVYNKNEIPLPGSLPLPNIGRETHTYLTHIVNNYDQLAETMVFLQGDPFFHLTKDGKAGVAELRSNIEKAEARKIPFHGLAWFRLKCDGLGRPHDLADIAKKGKWKGWGKDIPVAKIFERIFHASAPKQFIARGATGNFMVRRDRVLIRPRSFYEHCLSVVVDDPYDEINTGHAFERLWHLIFIGNRAWNHMPGKTSQLET